MSNNTKKDLINTLDNLINNNLNSNEQIGGKRYTKKEVNDMLMLSIQNIMLLYQKSIYDKQTIQNQINQIKQKSLNQSGGAKKYTKQEADLLITSSLQNVFSLYAQSENEKRLLTNELQQLLLNKNNLINTNLPTSSIIFTKWSVDVVNNYINNLGKNGKLLSLLIIKDFSKLDKKYSGIDNKSKLDKGKLNLEYININENTKNDIFKTIIKNTNKNNETIDAKFNTEPSNNLSSLSITLSLNVKNNDFGFIYDIDSNIFNKLQILNIVDPKKEIDLTDNIKFNESLGTTIDISNNFNDILLKIIIQHLKENVTSDLP